MQWWIIRNILECAGNLQLRAGQRFRYKSVIRTLSLIINEKNCDVVLIIYTDNAFNCLNRIVILHNIWITCPIIVTYVINTYNHQARLFIHGSGKSYQARELPKVSQLPWPNRTRFTFIIRCYVNSKDKTCSVSRWLKLCR